MIDSYMGKVDHQKKLTTEIKKILWLGRVSVLIGTHQREDDLCGLIHPFIYLVLSGQHVIQTTCYLDNMLSRQHHLISYWWLAGVATRVRARARMRVRTRVRTCAQGHMTLLSIVFYNLIHRRVPRDVFSGGRGYFQW